MRILPTYVNTLTIGFGFECLTDIVREITINKGYGPVQVDQAIGAIEAANQLQSRVKVAFEIYVMLKPLFLSEQEAIDEALRTINWAYDKGADTAVLFLNTVKINTVQGYFASCEQLRTPIQFFPPYYRSAIQVLRQLPKVWRQRTVVLGVQSGILAQGMPRGCALCAPFLLGALMAHNFTRDTSILDHAARSLCPCKDKWLSELDLPSEDLPTRIRQGLDALENELEQ